jgi:hypothetical protein
MLSTSFLAVDTVARTLRHRIPLKFISSRAVIFSKICTGWIKCVVQECKIS